MAELHRRRPNDAAILFALCDVLNADGRAAEAARLLDDAWRQQSGDVALLLRRFSVRMDAGDADGAARVIVEALADQPALAGQIVPAWERVLSPEGRPMISPSALARIDVPASRRGARGYVAWRFASGWPRSSVARAALDEAVAAHPVYAPAFRAKLAEVLADAASPESTRIRASEGLVQQARTAGEPALADELTARIALFQNDFALAVAGFSQVMRTDSFVPEVRLGMAESLRAYGDDAAFADQCSKLIDRFPAFDDGYIALCQHYLAGSQTSKAEEVLSTWESNQPWRSGNVRLLALRGKVHLAAGRAEAAELALSEAEHTAPADPSVLELMEQIYRQTDRLDRFAARMEQRLGDLRLIGPGGLGAVAARLSRLYIVQSRPADAVRVLDFAYAAMGGEPDLLCIVAEAYMQAGSPASARSAVERALSIDPGCESAARLASRLRGAE
jgi:predicted Zn-dependent protease